MKIEKSVVCRVKHGTALVLTQTAGPPITLQHLLVDLVAVLRVGVQLLGRAPAAWTLGSLEVAGHRW